MTIFRKIYCYIAALLLFPINMAAQDTIRFVGDNNYPPYEYIDSNGNAAGFDIDIIKAVMKEANIPYTLELKPWARAVDDVLEGRAHALTGTGITEKRLKDYKFSAPYAYIIGGIACKANNEYNSIHSLKNKRVAIINMAALKDYIREVDKRDSLNIMENCIMVDNMLDGLNYVEKGECEAAICSSVIAQYIIDKNNLTDIEVHPFNMVTLKYGIAFNKNVNAPIEKINHAIARVKSNGVYTNINQEWFGFKEKPFIIRNLVPITITIFAISLFVTIVIIISRNQVKNAEKRIKHLNSENSMVLRSLHVGVTVFDKNGQLYFLNEAAKKIFELKNVGEHEHYKYNIFKNSFISNEDLERIKKGEHFTTLLNCDLGYMKKNKIINTTSDKKKWLNVTADCMKNEDNEIDYFVVIYEDVTKEQKRTRELEENRLSMTLAVKSGGLVQWYYDCKTEHYTIENPEFHEETVGLTHKEYLNFIHPDDHHFVDSISKLMDNKEDKEFSENVRILMPNGKWSYETVSGSPVKDNDGNITYYTGFRKDNTEIIQLSKDLADMNEQLNLSFRLGNITPFIYNTSTKKFYLTSKAFKQDNDLFDDADDGLTLEQVLSRTKEDEREEIKRIFNDIFSGKIKYAHMDIHFSSNGQFDKVYETQLKAFGNDDKTSNEPNKILGYMQDITQRKFVETMTKRKEEFMKTLLDSIPIPVHIKDMEQGGIYTYWNAAGTKLFGDLLYTTARHAVNEEQAKVIDRMDQEVYDSEERKTGYEQIKLVNGKVIDTIYNKSVIYDGDKKLLLITRWDVGEINELQRRSKALSVSNAAMNAFNWFYDSRTGIVSFDKGLDSFSKDAKKNMTLNEVLEYVHPDDKENATAVMMTVLANEKTEFTYAVRLRASESSPYEWWELRGKTEIIVEGENSFLSVYGITINVNEHKKLSNELQMAKAESDKTNRLLNKILKHIPIGIFIKDVENENRFLMVNAEFTRFHHKPAEFFIGKKDEELFNAGIINGFSGEKDDMDVVLRGETTQTINPLTWNGKNYTVQLTKTLLTTADGYRYIIGTMQDITEMQRYQEELKLAKEKAEESDKLKSAFLANMSHEIRTPLNAIVGFSELLSDTEDKEERQEYINIIMSNNELLLRLIGDILDLSKLEAGMTEWKTEKFNLAETFDEMFATMKQKNTNTEVEMRYHNDFETCWVDLDKNRFRQVVTNFVTNAIKYTPSGHIEMWYEAVKEGIKVCVADTGIGIAPEKRDRVFQRFEKLDDFAQGTGLGLSICKAITDTIGGSIGFESEGKDKGSTFWAIFPCKPEVKIKEGVSKKIKDATTSIKVESLESEEAKKLKFLIAEDNKSNFILIRSILKGFDLTWATDGAEAVEFAKQSRFDIILMDMKMPVMNGLEATRQIRSFLPEIPIIAVTANAFDSDREEALKAGCNDFIAKPVKRQTIFDIIEKTFKNKE